jgi:hypothetical protein
MGKENNSSGMEEIVITSPLSGNNDNVGSESQPPSTEEPKKRNIRTKKDGTPDRRHLHLKSWKPGQSGNPKGKPKGTKNRTTLLKQVVLANAETLVLSEFEEIVKATLELAKQGDSTCLKIIWDRIIPSKRAIDEKEGKDDSLNISITIEGMEVKNVGGEPLDAEFTEVDNDTPNSK